MRDLLSPVWLATAPLVLSAPDWEAVLGQARQSGLVGRLGRFFGDRGWMDAVPPSPRRHLESGLSLALRQQHEVQWEVHQLSKALAGVETPVVLLKGAAYVMARLPCARGRLFADVDVLVLQAQLPAAEAALFGAGWISDERDAYNQRYYRQWMHEIPPLRHVLRGTVIDMHHTIAPPTSRFKVDARQLLERLVPLEGMEGVFVLSPSDMVLHSALHLFQEGEFGHGLRDLLDLNDLLIHFGSTTDFWDILVERADELQLQIPLFHALAQIQRLFGNRPPSHLHARIEAMGPNPVARALMSWSLGLALRPMHPSCDLPLTGVARWLLYVRSHALRMPLRLVITHLLRKAWMRTFPKREKDEVVLYQEA